MIYIGHFIHATNQEQIEEADRRHGEFNLACEAPEAAAALEMFRRQILYYRKRSEFFEGVCRIYLVQLIELDRFPDRRAVMLTYKSVAGDPVMPFIRCSIPGSDTDACRIFDWHGSQPRVDGEDEMLFLAFDD
jgi:hypothetical protein